MKSRTLLVYVGLAVAWALIVGWQAIEHRSSNQAALDALILRGRDITLALTWALRAQIPEDEKENPSWVIPSSWVQLALDEMTNRLDVVSMAVVNADPQVVASAGPPIRDITKILPAAGEISNMKPLWDPLHKTVTIANVVSFQPKVSEQVGENSFIRTLGPLTNQRPASLEEGFRGEGDPRPPPDDRGRQRGGRQGTGGRGGSRVRGAFIFDRPPFMTQEDYDRLMTRNEIHGFLIVMADDTVVHASQEDLWHRLLVSGFGSVSLIGLGLARRFSTRSGELQVRLVRASEMNTHLREMNLAAAGLAHETRNPLNIIRGLAQMISKSSEGEVRTKSREITEEVDRVSAQLNEFINYSKPREVRRAPVQLGRVIGDVLRALKDDVEEKKIALERRDEELTVEADQGMLRQVLFNLLINAIQFVGVGGEIQVIANRTGPNSAGFEVRDNGPGVPPENRESIFQPYFTTRVTGTGLGLAVVKQIIEAHGWEIHCLPNGGKGTVFRVSRLVLATDSRTREKKGASAGT